VHKVGNRNLGFRDNPGVLSRSRSSRVNLARMVEYFNEVVLKFLKGDSHGW
jgi:hypothetical protein